MKLLRLLALSGAAFALEEECRTKEFLANGYSTGQNIEMNYEASEIKLMDVEVDGETESQTFLHLEFLVPKRYTEQYQANSFALTFNRKIGVDQSLTIPETYIDENGDEQTYTDSEDHLKQMNMYVGEFNDDQSACFSNRYDNYTYCANMAEDLWTIGDNTENDCISDVTADIPWENVMDTAFGGVGADEGVEIQYNGNFIEIFLTATVETWTYFNQGHTEGNYLGVMTGRESRTNTNDEEGANNRKGEYRNDAGWLGWPNDPDAGEFGDIVIDDERYTLYQIPFILRFPRTVMVQTEFRAAQDLTLLTGVVAQDVIQINLNPEDDGVFAYVEAVLTTQIQYPYGIRSPHTEKNGMTVVIGDTVAGGGDHAADIEFIEFDPESVCNSPDQNFAPEGTCEQSFKFRITPSADNPCSVAGDYTFEMWATCIGARGPDYGQKGVQGCAIDDLVDNDDIVERRKSNSYFFRTIKIDHQDFCPELMDEVRVVGDFRVYKDEAFETRVDNDLTGNQPNDYKYTVYTNDQLFFEATYRTASSRSGETISDNGDVDDLDQDNDVDEYGKDTIIDYVRPTKIFMDVTLGQDRAGDRTTYLETDNGWNAADWADNMDFSPLGGPRIPGQEIQGESDEFTLETGAGDDGAGAVAKYQIVLCEVAPLPAAEIVSGVNKPDYCFAGTKDIAREYLDFTRVQHSKDGLDGFKNSIDENEVAFNLRMDERILPVKPSSDESYATFTIEAEVYYKGNRHPTTKGFESGGNRRRLQEGNAPALRRQAHVMSVGFDIFNNKRLRTCAVDNNDEFSAVQLKFAFNNAREMPTAADMASFTSDITKQIGEYHEVEGAVSVEQVERCESKDCRMLYARKLHAGYRRRMEEGSATQGSMRRMEEEGSSQGSSRRRMEEEGSSQGSSRRRMEEGSAQGSSRRLQADNEDGFFLYVTLGFKTTSNPAGRVMNVFQNNVVDNQSAMHRKIPLFASARVVEMTVDKCNGDLGMRMSQMDHDEGLVRDKRGYDALMDAMREEAKTQESAAPRAAAWLAGLLASLAYLAW